MADHCERHEHAYAGCDDCMVAGMRHAIIGLRAKLDAVTAEVDRTERLAGLASGNGPAKAFLALGFVAIAGIVRGDK